MWVFECPAAAKKVPAVSVAAPGAAVTGEEAAMDTNNTIVFSLLASERTAERHFPDLPLSIYLRPAEYSD